MRPDEIRLKGPFDAHVHGRDGALLQAVMIETARQFSRALLMPNLTPPVTSLEAAIGYRQRVLAAVPAGMAFEPVMSCYLTDDTLAADLATGFGERIWRAAKLYPANATTNAHHGVRDIWKIMPVLEKMAAIGMPLAIHGELADPATDIFDREKIFIDRVLAPLTARLPELPIVLEHITTIEAAAFVESAPARLAATITPHHLLINRNALFEGGLRPHHYCLPIAKREHHRLALRRAATGPCERFFLGTDTAPHLTDAKLSACGCAGIYNAPVALPAYVQVFEEEGALDRLPAFACQRGARFYGLPADERVVVLRRKTWRVPESWPAAGGALVPFLAGRELAWQVEVS